MNDLDAAHLAQLREADARYKETWDLSDLEARIRLARDVLRSHGSDTAQELLALEEDISVTIDSQAVAAEPEWAINPRIAVCLELASALEDRHTHLGLLEDLQEQISILELALQKVPPDSHAGICIRRDLGTALRQRFSQKSNELDLLQAIDIHTSSLESCPDGHPIRAHLLGLLALDLLDQGYRTGQADVLERSVSLAQQGADISLTSDPRHHQVQRCLSTALLGSFFVLGGANRLHAAKDICITLLNTFPPHCPIVTTIYGQLGVIMSQLFAQTDDMDYLKLTVEYTSLAFERIAKSSGLRPTIALNFASSLGLLHNRTGDIKDLQRGIEVLKEVQHIPNRADAHIFAQLGLSLCTLHSLLGEPDDLDESVRLLRKAAALHSNGGRPRIAAVENLAVALHARYKRDRILGDLAEGIELEREALQFYQSNKSHSLPAFNLANYLREYYRATGEVSYLEGSLAMFTEWFGYLDQSADSQMTHQGNWLRHHAEALLLRYELKSNPDDVYTAISQLRKSHELHPTTHVNHADTLINLAEALFHKMQIDHLDQDAHDALQCLTAALDSLPTGHPTRATPLFMMAKLYAMDTCPFQHIQKAVSSLRDGLQDRYQNALTRLTSALPILAALGEKTLRRDDHQLQQDLVDAYYSAVNLLPRVAYFGQDLPSRLRALASSDKLAADGAAHALLLSNPKLAIELLEQGRAVFWTQFLRLRSEFDGLPQAVASRLTQIAHALDQGAYVIQNRALSATENGNKAMVSKQEQQFVERRRLGNEFENMLGQVRQAPGLERFLLHNTFDMLAKVAEHGPVVVLLASEVTCQVIIIHSHGSATQILLPKVTVPYLEELGQKVAENISFKRGLLRNRGVITKAKNQRTGILEVTLDVLWRSVMSKVVHVLALKQATGRLRPRISLCATGAFAHLPLHATGVHRNRGREGQSLSDYCVISYAPTIGALLEARKRTSHISVVDAKMLVAAVSRPKRWAALPYATREVATIMGVIPAKIQREIISDRRVLDMEETMAPTVDTVLNKLPDASLLHLACHGTQDPLSPLDSGFVMQDGLLTLTKIMALQLDQKFFAFLSACETAKGDKAQPNQSLHLTAAMLFAGFQSVVGTMWSIGDADGPVVAEEVYTELFRSDTHILDVDCIPYALDSAARKLKDRGLSASRWAPFVHFGI